MSGAFWGECELPPFSPVGRLNGVLPLLDSSSSSAEGFLSGWYCHPFPSAFDIISQGQEEQYLPWLTQNQPVTVSRSKCWW